MRIKPTRKKRQAKERAEKRAQRSAAEQLQRLDELLGKDVGAKRERARLRQDGIL